MNKSILNILIATLLLLSCENGQKRNNKNESKKLVEIAENQIAIHDLVPISGDTLIAAIWNGGILRTIDGGENWIEIKTPLIKHLSVDNQNRVWGIDSWIGIHESSYSRIFYSDDYGDTWEKFEFNLDEFFPLEFPNDYSSVVQLITWDGLILEHKGGVPNDLENWKRIDKLEDNETEFKASNPKVNGNYRISQNGLLEKKDQENEWNKVTTIPNISIPFDILKDSNKVYVAAGGYGGYKSLFVEIINDSIQIEREMKSVQCLGVRKDKKGRIWTFGDGGIFQIDGDKLRKMK
ncbi:hypothetical protein BTO06_00930 [Tenacibaculum sp. SZ-18]|uniref:WD40/YVTN/BNR-like repeat-containing protein n=1 Tax=Tenacibaculum sp. SZ-18 TaxID=754423 RepID=UPI000C2D0DA2|nr:hypothetical protein [Tenacibaculum sp. SZ-18]AUC13798.1 hypothetical protein BTO06_00930 [Tenacibaculum sp. SZ-18]